MRLRLAESTAAGAALLSSLLLCSATAQSAVQELGSTATAPRNVVVYVTGSPEAIERTRETLYELFGRLEVSISVIATTDDARLPESTPLAIAYIDFSPPHATVVIMDGTNSDEVDRREFPDAETLETSVEASAHVVYSVVETMLTGEREERSEPPSEPIPPTPPTPPVREALPPMAPIDDAPSRPPPRHHGAVAVDAGVSFAVTRLAPTRVAPGGGLTLDVASVRYGFGASLYAMTYAPSALDYGNASAFARVSSVRALLSQDISLSSNFSVALAVGGGVEWLRLEPESAPSGIGVKARSLFSPLVTSLAGVRFKVAEHAFLSGWAGVDFDLSNERLVANVDGDRELVLALSGMRPTLMVTASTPLGVDTRFGQVENE